MKWALVVLSAVVLGFPATSDATPEPSSQPTPVPAPIPAHKRPPHPKPASVEVAPSKCVLKGKWAMQNLAVTGQLPGGGSCDLTKEARFSSSNRKVAMVGKDGVIHPVANGETTISVTAGGFKAQVQVCVQAGQDDTVSFVQDVMPLMSKLSCNQTACHGGQRKNGGFKLSLFGGEPDADHTALTKTAAGRRINKVEPDKSLLLSAAAGDSCGAKLKPGSPEYEMLRAWIAQGARRGDDQEPKIVALKLSASELVLPGGVNGRVIATLVLSDGSEKDVTRQTVFRSTDATVATVDGKGGIVAQAPGECTITAIMARQSAAVRVIIPQSLPTPFPPVAANNKIDELVAAKLKKLGLPPSDLCTDQEFLRRSYLDVVGLLPTPEEARAFLADKDPQKRARLIDALLGREEFADCWAAKWGDIFRIKSEYPVNVWPKAVTTYYRWLRDSMARNKPYDQFARELLTATGSNFRQGPVNFFRAVAGRDPQTLAETASLIFMGARIGCARCHAHPTENWSVDDNLGMAACFAKVGYKATKEWKEEIIYVNPKAALRDPRTREIVKPRLPDGTLVEALPDTDPRVQFADWLISPKNPRFNQTIVNRVWYWLMGRGIIHEPDDIRPTNLPENPELLEYLGQELVAHQYDLRHVMRLILNSRTYQLSSKPNPWNQHDTSHFSHYAMKRLDATGVLDAICQVTEAPENYTSWIPAPYTQLPKDYRAVQLYDSDIDSNVLDLFGRPARDSAFQCERSSDPSLRQTLYFVNSEHLDGKVTGSPRIRRLLQDKKTDPEIIEEFYLATLSRSPSDQEKQKAVAYLGKNPKDRTQAVQDLLWALLNTKEFLFIR